MPVTRKKHVTTRDKMVRTHAGRQQEGRKELERNRREVIVGRKGKKKEIGGFSSIDKTGISLEEEEEEEEYEEEEEEEEEEAALPLACCVSRVI
jgi:hypothetical protein